MPRFARRVIRLTLYSRPGCHLCDEMKIIVSRVTETLPVTLEVVDISTDSQLEAAYGLEIPVLLVDGRKAAKYRVTEEALRRLLECGPGRAGGPGKAGRTDGPGK